MIYSQQPSDKRRESHITWAHWFMFANFLLSLFIASLYAVSTPLPASLAGNLYLVTNWLGHMSFLSFVFFILFVLPVCYINVSSHFIRAWGAIAAAIGIALLVLDALYFTKTGTHIYALEVESLRQQASAVTAQLTSQYIGYLILLFVVWLSIQLAIANAIWKRLDRLKSTRLVKLLPSILVSCFTLSHVLHMWADAKFYRPILQQDDMFPLSYPLTAKTMMANYGLMDLQQWQQKESIQYNTTINTIQYPLTPVYCALDNSPIILLMVTDGITNWQQQSAYDSLRHVQHHYDLGFTTAASAFDLIYSVPGVFSEAFEDIEPIFLDLPAQLGHTVSLYQHSAILDTEISQKYQTTWQTFSKNLNQRKTLSIGLITSQQLQSITPQLLVEDSTIVITNISPQKQVPLVTNLPLKSLHGLSQHADIVPTVFWNAGCKASHELYSVGENLLLNEQSWLMNIDREGLLFQKLDTRIHIYRNGLHSATSSDGDAKALEELPMNELKKGIKTLTKFVK